MRWALLLVIAACSKSADPAPAEPPPQPQAAQAATAKHEDRHEPASAAPAISLAVSIAGAPSAGTTWTGETLASAPRMAGAASDGEARDTWSLRELARRNVGPDARVVAVIGPDGKQAIEPAAWSDATRTPILHTTRRGSLKFRWADKDGHWGPTVVRDVTGLEIAR
jgi:hypothetical protein